MTEKNIREELAAVYRLLHHFHLDDLIYTHVSAKIPGTNYFLINEFGLRFDEVTASNLVKIDIDGNVITGGPINPAGFLIHSTIHEYRPEVACIIHTHTKEGIAVSVDDRGLWPISQYSMLIDNIRYHNYTGLVLDQNEKNILKSSILDSSFLIMRNHGLLTTGNTIGDCFLNMRRLQKACEIQVLCRYENSLQLNPVIVKDNKKFIDLVNSKSSIPWNSLLRLVDKHYPDYKG